MTSEGFQTKRQPLKGMYIVLAERQRTLNIFPRHGTGIDHQARNDPRKLHHQMVSLRPQLVLIVLKREEQKEDIPHISGRYGPEYVENHRSKVYYAVKQIAYHHK